MKEAVFIDRDGIIIHDSGYVHKIEDFKLVPNAIQGLRLLKYYKLFIITNQSGIGRGFYKTEDFLKFNNYLLKELEKHNIKIEKTYYCPHKPEDNCECRKPKIRFLKEAEKEFNINLKESFVIGDRKSDFEMGKSAGCKTIHVLTGYGINAKNDVNPDYFAKDLVDAAQWILKNTIRNNSLNKNFNQKLITAKNQMNKKIKLSKKIITFNKLIPIVKNLKKQNKKIVTTNGVFDILHLGHVKYLESAKRLGDVLVVGVNTDYSVKQIKGDKRPINDEKSRLGVLAALESVDHAFLFNEKDPRNWIKKIKPDIHVKAGDYKMHQIIERDAVEKNGGKIVIAKMKKNYSTTGIINKILKFYKN